MTSSIDQAWTLAKERFAQLGIDAEAAIKQLDTLPVSIHCWQGMMSRASKTLKAA